MSLDLKQLELAVGGFIFVWLTVLSFLFYRLAKHYYSLTKGITKKDLKTVLEKLLENLNQDSRQISHLAKQIESVKKDNLYNVQKIGLVRFNPFPETGGDQSFCLALLDGHDNGLVIYSLHTRENTRIYAKPVKKGKAMTGYEFSREEQEAIKNAKKIK